MRVVAIVALLAAPFVKPVAAQRAIDLTGKPEALVSEPFTTISGVRESSPNLGVVTDQLEHRVFVVSFPAGTVRQIGRQGDGPAEYRFPMAPLPAPANASFIYDASLRRLLVVSPEGKFADPITVAVTGVPGGIIAARGTDRDGRVYFEGNSFNSETGGFIDSVTIVRWNPRTGRAENLGKVWSGGRVSVMLPSGRASLARIVTPFPHMDAWTVLPDGRIAVVEHDPFRVVFLETGGARRAGPAIAYTPIPITAAERAAYRERHASVRGVAVNKDGGGVSTRMPPVPDAEFPEDMPAFIATAVLATPEGEIWIGRSHASSDQTWRYDIFDGQGKQLGSARLRANSVIVGFGTGSVYVARTDPADDLVYLERYRR